jgi:alpha-1,2-mannosyltransferase
MLPSRPVLSEVYGLRVLAQPAGRRAVLLVVLAMIVAYRAMQFAAMAADDFWGADFAAYWTAGKHLLAGEPIYSQVQLAGPYVPEGLVGFLYAPPSAVVFAAIAYLSPDSYQAAAWIWVGLGTILLLGSVVAVARAEELDRRVVVGLPTIPTLVVLALIFPPILGEITVGNVHLELLALLSLAWLAVRRQVRAGDAVAGLAIGAATVIKVFPGLLIVWLVARGRYRAAAWSIGAAVALAVGSVPFVGIQAWLDFPTALRNMGPIASTIDAVSPTVWLAPALGFDVARWLVLAIGTVAVVWIGRNRDLRIGFAAVVCVSVLVAPSVFHHYLTMLVLPLLLALGAGVPLRVVGLSYVLMFGGQQAALGEWSWVLSRVPQTLGYALLVVTLLRQRPRPAGDGSLAPMEVGSMAAGAST